MLHWDHRTTSRISLAVMVLATVILFALQLNYHGSSYRGLSPVKKGWTMNGHSIDLMPAVVPQAGRTYTITHDLPTNINLQDVIVFKTENIFWRLYIGDRLVDYYAPQQIAPGMTPGSNWNIVMIPSGIKANTFSIEMDVPYHFPTTLVKEVFFSNHRIASESLLQSFVPAIFLTIINFAFAIMAIIGNILFTDPKKSDYSLCWFGLYSISMSIWSIAQSPFLSTLYGRNYVLVFLQYISMPLSTGFATLYCMRIGRFHKNLIHRILAIFPFALAVVTPILELTHTIPFAESIVVNSVLYIYLMSLMVYSNVLLIRKRFLGKDSSILLGVSGLIILAVMWLDIFQTRLLNDNDYTGNLRVAIFIYLIIFSIDRLMVFVDYRQKMEEARAISKMAYTDALTSIGNRMGFNKHLAQLTHSSETAFVSLDLNNLKKVNDNFGHIEGDRLISTAAHLITRAFEKFGTVYRTGGDEFIVIVEHFTPESMTKAYNKMDEICKVINTRGKLSVELSLARGYANYVPEDGTLITTLNRADEEMYENKRQMKATR